MHHFPTLSAAMAGRQRAECAQQAALRAAWPADGAAAAQPLPDAQSGQVQAEARVVVGVGLEYQCWATGTRRLISCREALAAASQHKAGGSQQTGTCVPLAVCLSSGHGDNEQERSNEKPTRCVVN